MKKYLVSYTEVVYYSTTEIEAQDEEHAENIFRKLLDDGDIDVNETEGQEINIEEVK